MPTDNRSREEILSENATLKLRLEEAEETLHAIQSGDVDALVVSTLGGDQVFTLKGAEHPYRILVETMSEGAAFLTSDGTILYCNKQLADLLQAPMEKLIGSRLTDFVASQDRALVANAAELTPPPNGVGLGGNSVELTPSPHGGRLGWGQPKSGETFDLTCPHPNPPPWGRACERAEL